MKYLLKSSKMSFDQSWIYILVLVGIASLGFGPSYFLKVFGASMSFNIYFHFHAVMMVLWVLLVFAQPLLIRLSKFNLHRLLGKISYLIFPIMIVSILLLTQSQMSLSKEINGSDLFIPLKDVIMMSLYYILAVRYKEIYQLHSRLMIASIIPMIEPSLIRMLFNVLPEGIVQYSYQLTIVSVEVVILILAINDMKRIRVRWVFSSLFIVMSGFQAIIFWEVTESDLMISIAKWYASLN
ncbi:MAG: hypothetical protein NXI20_02920 [bacterium]|nr:hypothetical protein [bacterium]